MNDNIPDHARHREGAGSGTNGRGKSRAASGRRRRIGLAAVAVAAVAAGSSVALFGATAAAGPSTVQYGPVPTHTTQPQSTDPWAVGRLRARIAELRLVEGTAIRRGDVADVQGIEAELAQLNRQLAGASNERPVGRTGTAAARTPITAPVSAGGAFSDGRDAAFEAALVEAS